jgi:trk system potassium uptake protein TrkA
MNIVIVGAGDVGSYVARIFIEEGHDVSIVEQNEDLARRLDASLNAQVVAGSGVRPDILQQAGLDRADLFLAVTAVDEVNLIACMTARKLAGGKLRTVARVRQARHMAGDRTLSAEDLGLDALISPEQSLATSTDDILRYSGSGEMRELAAGKIVLVRMALSPDSPMTHETLGRLRSDLPVDFRVVAVERRDGISIPTDGDRLEAGDAAFVLTVPKNLTELAILSGTPWHDIKRVLIVGCGNTGFALARELESQKYEQTVIERDPERAEFAAGHLSASTVLHGDGSDPEFLREQIEEGGIDAVLVLIKNPEKAVLIGIFAKSLGARKVIVRCDKAAFVHLAHDLGVDAVISPKRAMTNAILRYVRRGRVASTLLLGEHEAEIIEFRVPHAPASPDILAKPIKDLPLPEGSLIGAVIRNGEGFVASGETRLEGGDKLFVACVTRAIRPVERLFS